MSAAVYSIDESIPAYGVWTPKRRETDQGMAPFFFGKPTASISAKEVFRRLAERWKAQTSHLSFVTQRLSHPDYLKILSMGESALPYILEELERDPDHWFHALTILTGENPVPKDFRGSVHEAAEIWIRWGREHHAT